MEFQVSVLRQVGTSDANVRHCPGSAATCDYSDACLCQTVEQTFTFNLNVRAWQATCGHYLRLADARYYAQEATRLSLAAMLNGTVESLTLPHVIPPVSIRLCRHRPLVFYSPTHSLACRFCGWRHPTRLWLCRRQRRGLNTRSGRTARLDHKHSQAVASFGRLRALLGRCTRLPGLTHKPSGHRFIPCRPRRHLERFYWAQVHATPDVAPHWPRCNMICGYQGPSSDCTSPSLFLLVASCAYSWSESRCHAVLHSRVDIFVSAHVDLHSVTSSMTTCGTVELCSIAVWYVNSDLCANSHASAYMPALQDVYRARMLDQLELEESLYEAIIDIYRRYSARAGHCALWM